MDQEDVRAVSSPINTSSKYNHWLLIILYIFVCLFIAIVIGISGYYFGYKNAQEIKTPTKVMNKIASKLLPTPTVDDSEKDSVHSIPEEALYTLSFFTPAGWHNMLWHDSAYTTEDAILSPDYTPLSDPEPQTGIAVLIYEVPGVVTDIKQLRPIVEQTEDGLQSLTQTTVGGYSAYYAIFQCTDDSRVLYDYHILKDHDHWVVRFIFPGTSLTAAQEEAQKYNYQINAIIQSIQFKPVQGE